MSIAIVPLFLLGACAGTEGFPSLERRPQERVYGTAMPAQSPDSPTPAASATPDANLAAKLASLRANARAAHDNFLALQPAAARSVVTASGAQVASESWSVAQVALAGLDSARSQAMIALADLDRLLIAAEQDSVVTPSPDLPAVQAARDEVTGLISAEDSVLSDLRGRMKA